MATIHTQALGVAPPPQGGAQQVGFAEPVTRIEAVFYLPRSVTIGQRDDERSPFAHGSGDVADILQRPVNSIAPTRSSLIRKGMAYSPAHGDIAFTVPLFDGFMQRIMRLET